MKMTAMDANKKIRDANWLCAKRASNVSAWAIMSGIWTTNFMYTRFMTCSIGYQKLIWIYLAAHCPTPFWNVGMMLSENTNGPMKVSTSRYIFAKIKMMNPIHSARVAMHWASIHWKLDWVIPTNAFIFSNAHSSASSSHFLTLIIPPKSPPLESSSADVSASARRSSSLTSAAVIHLSYVVEKPSMISQSIWSAV